MEKFEVHILGCGSALPTGRHLPTAQVVNFRDKLFMIDCGEGTQLQFRNHRLKLSRLNAIFLSHLHGDHCFGLMGLISTLNLLGRTATLHIYAPIGTEAVFRPSIDFFNQQMSYPIVFHEHDTKMAQVIYEDKSLMVETIPLKHRIPCVGFLFREKPGLRHIIRDMVDFYQVPICEMNRLRNGADFTTPEGLVIANARLTSPADPTRSYAFCSDTAYYPAIIEQLTGVDLLYHEATFIEADLPRAKETNHSVASQAAKIAEAAKVKRLLIGHYSARYDDESQLLQEAKALFPNTIATKEGMKIDC